jgi:hypothetical protein
MRWELRRQLLLIALGCLVLVASGIVLALNQDASTEILAAVGILGGAAIIVNALPANGANHD